MRPGKPEPWHSMSNQQPSEPVRPVAPLPRRGGGAGSSPWWVALLLAAITFALYWPVLHCGFVNYDDPDYVTANPRVQSGLMWPNLSWAFTTGVAGNWHPLTWLSLMLDVSLWGRTAAGFHFTNLLLHSLNACLLFGLLHRLTGAIWRSAAVAALFAWHPVHVESVAWVAERKDVLSTFWGFLALWWYVLYAQTPLPGLAAQGRAPIAPARGRRGLFYALSLVTFALGLLSKQMLVTWPGVMWLLDYWPLARFRPGRGWPLLREKLPFLALSVMASAATLLVQSQVGAVAAVGQLPLGMRLGNVLVSYARYLGKLFWPTDLAIFYPFAGYWPLVQVSLAVGLLAGLTAWFWWWRQRQPYLLVGWWWFMGTLVPVIGLVQVGDQAMADRYTYIPSVGILMVFVWGAHALTRGSRWLVGGATGVVVAGLLACLPLTRRQISCWQNSETLFQHALAVTQDNFVAHNNLGAALRSRGQIDAAIQQFQATLRIHADDASAHYNLGLAFLDQSRTNAALEQFQAAVRYQPEFADAHDSLGSALLQQGQPAAALREWTEAIRLQPGLAVAHFNLGTALMQQGQMEAASQQLQIAVQLQPNDPEAHNNLGIALNQMGQADAAMVQFQETLRLQPARAVTHYNLGILLIKQGQTAAAMAQLQAAIQVQPDYAEAHNNLGFLLAQGGRLDEAIQEFQTALHLRPDFAGAQNNLARALALKNQAH